MASNQAADLASRVAALEAENRALRSAQAAHFANTSSSDAFSSTYELLLEVIAENETLRDSASSPSSLADRANQLRALRDAVNAPPPSPSSTSTSSTTPTPRLKRMPTGLLADDSAYTLRFTRDSPKFQNRVDEVDGVVDALDSRLKEVGKVGHRFCESGKAYAEHCGALAAALSVDWSMIETGDRALTLGSVNAHLAELLASMSQSLSHLCLSVDTLLVQSVNSFRDVHVRNYKESKRRLDAAREAYEDELGSELHGSKRRTLLKGVAKRAKARAKALAKKAKSAVSFRAASSPDADDLADEEDEIPARTPELQDLCREFELARFDHVRCVNDIHTQSLLEIVEMVSASLFSFVTFFHEGEYLAHSLKPEVELVHHRAQRKRKAYIGKNEELERRRAELAARLQDTQFTVEQLFPDEEEADAAPNQQVVLRGQQRRVEKQGYLWKQSSSLKKDWKRRWFVLEDGQLFYVRSPHDLSPQHVVNVLICGVRSLHPTQGGMQRTGSTSSLASISEEAQQAPFAFQLISPNSRTYILQAESEEDMNDWLQVFQNCTESMLIGTKPSESVVNEGERDLRRRMSVRSIRTLESDKQRLMAELQHMNNTCVDCGMPDPDWASINLGVMMCIECSGIHRSLGVHVSKVRSVTLDSWEPALLQLMLSLGNKTVNAFYEHAIHSEFPKPSPSSAREDKDSFCKMKWSGRAFMDKTAIDVRLGPAELGAALHEAARDNEVETMMKLVAFGVDVNWQHAETGKTALHVAAANSNLLCAEYLLQNRAKPSLQDAQGRTPVQVADEAGYTEVAKIIRARC